MPPPRFVDFIRVSGEAQEARDTPADQRRALDRLRQSRPGVLVERIDLGAISGAADERPDLARLFALLAAGAVDEVRVRHIDRLTRHPDPRQRAAILGALIDAGAKVVEASGREIDPADEMGELDLTLQGWIAARERKRILERTLAARRRLAAEGKIQGRPPWGRRWDKAAGTWSEDPRPMAVYRRIFAEVIAGRTLHEVADRLNRDRIPTPRGREWTAAHVSRLVRAKSATGELEGWGQTFRIPAVVDARTWRAALAALEQNRRTRAGPPGHHPAMLRRVLRCGACGSPMWVQRGGRPGDVRTYYVCSMFRRTEERACRTYHAAELVDAAVREKILAGLRQPARLRAGAARGREGDPLAEAREAVEAAEKELRALAREETRLARLTTRGLVTEVVGGQMLREVAQRRNAAEVERAAALGRVEALTAAAERQAGAAETLEQLAAKLDRARPALWARFVREQFPRGYGIRLWPTGRFTVAGLWDSTRRAAAATGRR